MVRDLEDFTYGSWGRMTVQLGEQYLLSAALDKTMPTGSVAAVTLFYDLPRRVVHDEVMFAFKAFMKDAEARGLAWTQVRHSFQGGAAYGHGASAADVVRAVLNDFLDKHEDEGGFVAVPRCKCESITGGTCVKRCLPTVEVVVDGSEKLVACRVQMPLMCLMRGPRLRSWGLGCKSGRRAKGLRGCTTVKPSGTMVVWRLRKAVQTLM